MVRRELLARGRHTLYHYGDGTNLFLLTAKRQNEPMTAKPICDSGPLEYMATLSLLPPYSLDDVKAAYRAKVLETHRTTVVR